MAAIVTTLAGLSCYEPVAPGRDLLEGPQFVLGLVTRIEGVGRIGDGSSAPGENLQTFDLDVPSLLITGRVAYTDYGVVRPNGMVATLTVDPLDLGTSIASFLDSSSLCEPSGQGVEFEGVGRLDTGELVRFRVRHVRQRATGLGGGRLRNLRAGAFVPARAGGALRWRPGQVEVLIAES